MGAAAAAASASDQLKWSRKLVRLTTGALLIYLIVTPLYLINKNNHDYYEFAGLTGRLFISRGNSKQQSYCLSREAISSYRNPSPHKPSAYLLRKLREYEELHHRCGPGSQLYTQTINDLVLSGRGGDHLVNKNNNNNNGSSDWFSTECGYIVWRTAGGLGNQMMTIVSGFLYALLTNRVFLVEFGPEDANLFCEPFFSTSFSRSSSWILPDDFPHKKDGFKNLKTFQSMMENAYDSEQQQLTQSMMDILYVNLGGKHFEHVKYFHCDQGHALVRRFPVLVIKSDLYYTPSLFMTPFFTKELDLMFPKGNKATVFHHLGRYLFNPSNEAWEHITHYYNTNLAKARVKIGLQIRLVKTRLVSHRVFMDQILACTHKHAILPPVSDAAAAAAANSSINATSISSSSYSSKKKINDISTAILVTSLFPHYFKNLTAMYSRSLFNNITTNIKVYQPSIEGRQKMRDADQNMKALVEMYLLSFCDKLVTTGESTFGYVAQGLGGLRPWVLTKPETSVPAAACWRAPTIDPCFHYPPRYDCNSKKDIGYLELSNLFPFIRICEDRSLGFRLSDGT